ncbi:hypothetical protein [Roseisolibacter sp. H3M3-2]|uniref:hypothetical protein n=1 Tax=Roseisolibacter sp. H3M3-2 TaxID=3031323 RepID=UPI0023DA8B1C|nr:hypothetical protein [Roseisolibacter sp. H3M3-2]MDF1505975.1 hypothetical protein [Roseisolibacter sp. H3M3-2]
MYARCLFCQADLGRNAAVEHFPVGRRLAYDAAKGRLWVVCRRCARWNLTPLEERWAAIEEAEALFSRARRRIATDNVGLARVADGTELVRVGAPPPRELAAWRYGDQFGRRRRRQIGLAGVGVAVGAAVIVGGPVTGLLAGGAINAVSLGYQAGMHWWMRRRVVARVDVPQPDGGARELRLAALHAGRARLHAGGVDDWALEVAHMGDGERLRYGATGLRHETPSLLLRGDAARRAAGRILPHVNVGGGARRTVDEALGVLEGARTVDRLFIDAARHLDAAAGRADPRRALLLGTLPASMRLALEMAAHAEQERRAMEGELAELERAWREAEEIAAIADDLLLPARIRDRLR